jgi:glycosyl transferase, family 25
MRFDVLAEEFDARFVISLPERTDRQLTFFTDIVKVTGAKVELRPGHRYAEPGGFRGVGERGSMSSQIAVLQEAYEAGYQRVLVMEDDCVVDPRINEIGDRLHRALAVSTWDVALLGVLPLTPLRAAGDPARPLVSSTVGVYGAHMVAYTRAGLERLLPVLQRRYELPFDSEEGHPITFDGELTLARWTLGLRSLVAVPSLAAQRPSRSDITPGRWDSTRFGRSRIGRIALTSARRVVGRGKVKKVA